MHIEHEQKIHDQQEFSFLEEDIAMQEIMKHHIEEGIAISTLSIEERECILLAVLCSNQAQGMIQEQVLKLLNIGVTHTCIREVMYHCIPYAGLLPLQQALKELHEVCKRRNLVFQDMCELEGDATRLAKGYAIQCSAFPSEVIQQGYAKANKDLLHMQKFLSAHCFGDFYTREPLTLKQRELLTFSILASLGGCESQLKAHVNANIRVNNTRGDLISAITYIQPYIGFPRTLNAMNIIEECTGAQGREDENYMMKETLKCSKKGENKMKNETLFPIGKKNDAYAQYFIGQSYLEMLVEKPFGVANVTFEPSCRNNWHIHHKGGQILLVTNGTGWYQEWGKEAQKLVAGDVVNIPAEVKHWHGATKDSWFSHIAIEVPSEGASNEWLEAVEEETYQNLK